MYGEESGISVAVGAHSRDRTGTTKRSQDFKSCVSTSSTMWARNGPAIAVDTGVIKHLCSTKQWLITFNIEINRKSGAKPVLHTALKHPKSHHTGGPAQQT